MAESGTHGDLIDSNGVYAHLWNGKCFYLKYSVHCRNAAD